MGCEQPRLDGRSCSPVNLPHDWSIEDRAGAPNSIGKWMPPNAEVSCDTPILAIEPALPWELAPNQARAASSTFLRRRYRTAVLAESNSVAIALNVAGMPGSAQPGLMLAVIAFSDGKV